MFLPLIMVSIVSVMAISIFEPHSIYAMRLARQGRLVTHHTDRSVLTLMSLDSVIDKNFTAVEPEMPLGELVNAISKSHTSFIPVVDTAGVLVGIIDINKIRHVMFRTELYHRFTVSQILIPPQATLGIHDSMEEVMEKFDKTNANYLPIVDVNDHLTGFVDRTRLYSMYRKTVADFSAE